MPPEQAAYLSFWDLWEVAVDTTGCVGCILTLAWICSLTLYALWGKRTMPLHNP